MVDPNKQIPDAEPAAPMETIFPEAITSRAQATGRVHENLYPGGTAADRELRESVAYHVFVGAQGLRPGWSVLVFVSIFMLLTIPAQLLVTKLLRHSPPTHPPPFAVILSEGSTLGIIAITTLIMAKIEGRPFLSYGFSGSRKLSRFFLGILSGIVALAALVQALKSSGLLVLDGRMLHGLTAWKYAFAWGAGFLLVALVEESLLRGYVQVTLTRGIGFWWAALLLSAGFGLLHLGNDGESPVGIFATAAIGLLFCLSLWLTKSLWWAVGMHAGWDWAQSYLYGVADSGIVVDGHLYATHPTGGVLWSGGPTGPEGSLYIFPLLLVVAAVVWLTLKPRSRDFDIPLRKAA